MSAMPIYGKTLKNLLLQNQESFEAETWYIVFGTLVLPNLLNDDPMMTSDLPTAWSNCVLVTVAVLEEYCMASADMQICRYAMAVLLR